ncbi:hypothetical protein E2562_004132 [Oryza meyeriana var. granulata]|uniref:Uncharacterized protein n=1 Tax=Oryza meyeriana var. granulata TaxID=110450 RepID=A0A6G1EV63_9ORYZ|nr:hypothetical protein E2562_004132 [Oryza meyeriana var. granulata]
MHVDVDDLFLFLAADFTIFATLTFLSFLLSFDGEINLLLVQIQDYWLIWGKGGGGDLFGLSHVQRWLELGCSHAMLLGADYLRVLIFLFPITDAIILAALTFSVFLSFFNGKTLFLWMQIQNRRQI